jgi:cytochrome P450/NADPH-cytochrome P450 reductase
LNALLYGQDPKTGKTLGNESIVNNIITFLIAGHETTSGALSFAFYNLLTNPKTLKIAQDEVDRVIGTQNINAEHLSRLPYI